MPLIPSLRAKQDRVTNARRVAELVALRAVDPRRLNAQDYRNAAETYDTPPEGLHALADVESGVAGFTEEGRLLPLFEPHVFSRETRGAYDAFGVEIATGKHVSASYKKWLPPGQAAPNGQTHPYSLSFEERWQLIAFVAELHFDAALKATSWGAFQVLGRNHAVIGYPTVWHMVCAFYEGELVHLDAALRFLKANDVFEAFRASCARDTPPKKRAAAAAKWITAWNGPGQVPTYTAHFSRRLDVRRTLYTR